MAGKFVSIEEAARLLGVSIDEVNRLVDRKKLFPMRDGGTVKFRVDDIERVAASLEDETSKSESLTLDLDLPGSGASGPEPALDLGDAIDVGDLGLGSAADAGSQTIIRGGAAAPAGVDGLSGLEIGDDDEDTSADSDDLVLESNIGASSPSLVRPAFDSGALGGSGAAGLDAGGTRGSQATGSGAAGSGGAGSGFAIPADSGLSLEDDGLGGPGLDLDIGPVAGMSGAGGSLAGGSLGGGSLGGGSLGGGSLAEASLAGDSLAGDAFELGADVSDEDSASVVIATEESGDSSFFGNVADDAASVAFDDSSVALDSSSASMVDGGSYFVAPVETSFSGWQIAGLTCCALLLLVGAFVMFEVAWTIRTPQGMPASAPLFDGLGALIGWQK